MNRHATYLFFWLAFAIQFTKKTDMNKLQSLIMKHPTRRKYALMIADVFFVLIAIKMFINYSNIQVAIEQIKFQTEQQQMQLEFTKNFQLPYEASAEANIFLKHENNVFLPGEVIIKFQDKPKALSGGVQSWSSASMFWQDISNTTTGHPLIDPQESRQQFLQEKFK